MALFKLFGQGVLVVGYTAVKLFLGNIHILNFDIEILTSRQAIVLLLNFVVCHSYREIVDGFFIEESVDNLINLVTEETTLLVVCPLCILLPVC